jgi:hypothetical protein
MALILRSSREAASRRRRSVLSGHSFETPLAAAPQEEGERDDRDHRPTRHAAPVMAGLVPAIPMLRGAALQTIGITGTSPVMTAEGPRAE